MTLVSRLQPGSTVGKGDRKLYVVHTSPKVTPQGTIKAEVFDVRGEEPEVRQIEWLYDHPVHVIDARTPWTVL